MLKLCGIWKTIIKCSEYMVSSSGQKKGKQKSILMLGIPKHSGDLIIWSSQVN